MDPLTAALVGLVGTLVAGMQWTNRQLINVALAKLDMLISGQSTAVASVSATIRAGNAEIESRLDRVTRAIELSAQADMLRILSTPGTPPAVREQAERIAQEIQSSKT